jgi:hypothetical protein
MRTSEAGLRLALQGRIGPSSTDLALHERKNMLIKTLKTSIPVVWKFDTGLKGSAVAIRSDRRIEVRWDNNGGHSGWFGRDELSCRRSSLNAKAVAVAGGR